MNLQKLTSELGIIMEGLLSFAEFEEIYSHRLYKNYQYTDSVRQNMIETRSAWVVERIFALQHGESALCGADTQLWSLKIFEDASILLVCTDKKGTVVYFEHRDPVEYPKEELSFILERGVLALRS